MCAPLAVAVDTDPESSNRVTPPTWDFVPVRDAGTPGRPPPAAAFPAPEDAGDALGRAEAQLDALNALHGQARKDLGITG